MSIAVSVALLAVVTAMTCALPGTVIVLRRQSMIVDAISHSVLPGIVLGVLVTGTTHSPVMALLAAVMGMIVVIGAELARRSDRVRGDAAIGLVFPVLFAVGVLLMSTLLSSVDISEHTVLAGDLNLMALPSEHLVVGTRDLGPTMMWWLLAIACVDGLYLAVFRRVLITSTFDPILARALGMPVRRVDLGFMGLVCLTVVVAFQTAGSILVVSLVVVPAATALLVARSVREAFVLAEVAAVVSALLGFLVAWRLDLATAATTAVVAALVFGAVGAVAGWTGRMPQLPSDRPRPRKGPLHTEHRGRRATERKEQPDGCCREEEDHRRVRHHPR